MAIQYPVAKDKQGNIVDIENAIKGKEYFCPFCGTKIIAKVGGKIREHHFAHKDKCIETWKYENKTPWHRYWQGLFPEHTEVLLTANDVTHIADILINNIVIEIQHSPMTIEEFRARNDFYTSLGYKVVWIWDLTDKFEAQQISKTKNNYFEYIWKYTKSPFRSMYCPDEKALIYVQLEKITDENTPVLHKVLKGYESFRKFASKEQDILSPKSFVDAINNNKERLFQTILPELNNVSEDDNFPFVKKFSNISTNNTIIGNIEMTTIEELWDDSFRSMVVKSNNSNQNMFITGRDGRISRNKYGRIIGKYTNKVNGNYQYSDYYPVKDANERIWTRVTYRQRDLANERINDAKGKIIYCRNKELDYHNAFLDREYEESKEELLLEDMITKQKGNFVAKSLFDNKYYYFNNYDGEYFYDAFIYDIDKRNFLDGCVVNYIVRKFPSDSKWHTIDFKSIRSIETEREPKYVKVIVEEPIKFYGKYTLTELVQLNKDFIAKCIETNEVFYFKKMYSHQYNEFLFDMDNMQYDENSIPYNWKVFRELKNNTWMICEHDEDGKSLKLQIKQYNEKMFSPSYQRNSNLYPLMHLITIAENDTIDVKCELTNYIYTVRYSKFKGSGIIIIDKIVNPDTGEDLSGDLNAFSFDMVDLPIWYMA